jgi:hypothetical protein
VSDPTPEDITRPPVENLSKPEGECDECDAHVTANRDELESLASFMGMKPGDFAESLDVYRADYHARHGVGMPGDGPS